MNMNNKMGNMRQGCGCGQMNPMNHHHQMPESVPQSVDSECGCQSSQCSRRKDKQYLMNEICKMGFAMTEAILFLDTHPGDENALNYYVDIKEGYRSLMNEYEEAYGPISSFNVTPDNYWDWVSSPMPWEASFSRN
jgi:spore coat protein JB